MKVPRSWFKHFILDEEHHLIEVDLMTWARWFEDINNRIVDHTTISARCEVSTVFLGLDHRFGDEGPPILFETMVFGGPANIDQSMWRYSSWDDAEAGHAAAVKNVLAAIKAKAKA